MGFEDRVQCVDLARSFGRIEADVAELGLAELLELDVATADLRRKLGESLVERATQTHRHFLGRRGRL